MNTPIITITKEHIGGVDETFMIADKQWLANICNKAIEIAIAEQSAQQESEYIEITAAQARELGAGNAEWCVGDTDWYLCDHRYWTSNLDRYDSDRTRYRAIKQAQPEPVPYPRPYDPNLYCMVSKDGEPAIRMLRTDAQALQAELGDTVEWFLPEPLMPFLNGKKVFDFTNTATYTYRAKPAKVVKWGSLPVGVALTVGTLIAQNAEGSFIYLAKDEISVRYIHPPFVPTLAPAADQPWIAFQGKNIHEQINKLAMAGFALEVDGNRYRVLSLAEGYEMEKAK